MAVAEPPKRSRDARLLANLAATLDPELEPFYVSGSPGGRPDGWYWKPAGANGPRYLGRNIYFAESELLRLVREAPDAA